MKKSQFIIQALTCLALALFAQAASAEEDQQLSAEQRFLQSVRQEAQQEALPLEAMPVAPSAAAATPAPAPAITPLAPVAEPVVLQEVPEEAPAEAPVALQAAPAKAEPAPAPAPVVAPAPTPAAAPVKDSFIEALAQVYTSNPTIKAQREVLNAIDEGVMQALSGALPSLSADYNKGRERNSIANGRWKYGDAASQELNLNQNLFNGGETYASFKAAKERVKAGRAQLAAVEQQVLYDAVVAYTDVVEKQLVLEVNQRNVDVLGKQLEATSARFEVGDITRTDVAQAEARLAKAKADERQALGDLESSRATYKRVIGAMPPERLTLPPLPNGLPATHNAAQEMAMQTHPDLEASRQLEKVAESTVDVRTSALLPDVSLNASATRAKAPSAATGLATSLDTDALTVNFSIPLYQSGAEWSRIREAKNQAQQAKFNTLDTRNFVIESVDRAWQDFKTAQAVIISSEEALRAAEVALEGINQENQSGLRTILDVLDTEQQAFNARLNLVKAQRAEKTQAYRLLGSIGRLNAKDLALPVNLHDPSEHYDNVKYKLIGW